MILNQIEFSDTDMAFAKKMAKRLGFTQTAYTSTSELIGLYCLPDRAGQKHGVIVKVASLGFLFVSTLEDLQLFDLDTEQREECKLAHAKKKQDKADLLFTQMMMNKSFHAFEKYAATKGIVVTRYNPKDIELTTPCGGTTAECGSLREAMDTICNDPTFSDLPLK